MKMVVANSAHPSPFLHQFLKSRADSLAILHIRRDTQYPLVLRERDDDDEGYKEGKVVNTRFGSFPHSTLIGVEHGTPVRASKVDTGTRGRRAAVTQDAAKKRKRKDDAEIEDGSSASEGEESPAAPTAAVVANSGFGHLLSPTPELWTASLPHRTQVVYAPDYNYILQRLRARPGCQILEAGGGSGSFTHAAVRAIFDGYPRQSSKETPSADGRGHVWTFEHDAERARQMQVQMQEHCLDRLVTVTHRDVYAEGFCLPAESNMADVKASIVFLDLPAPWRALPHLDRDSNPSPLDPHKTVHLCTFSPCIEQVQRTVSVLRARGWVEVGMVELHARRLDVRRERVGLHEEGLRGVNSTPATVDEAVQRLREHEERMRIFTKLAENQLSTKQERLQNNRNALLDRSLYKEGRLVHRSEPEIKTHTSYLVFAVLPMKWTEADEAHAQAAAQALPRPPTEKSKKQKKREAKASRAATGAATVDSATAATQDG